MINVRNTVKLLNGLTHTHTLLFMAFCPGLSRWASTRTYIHPLIPENFRMCDRCLSTSLILRVVGKIIESSALIIRLDTTPSGPLIPPPPSSPQFYARCPSCRNPPNLSWLGTGTKYAGLHTWRLGLNDIINTSMVQTTPI